MSDATLGFQINSQPVAKAVVDLDALTAASVNAESATDTLGKTTVTAGASTSQLADRIVQATGAAANAVAANNSRYKTPLTSTLRRTICPRRMK